MDLVQDLPDLWKQKHGVLLQDLDLNLARAASPSKSPPGTPKKVPAKTPLKVLANATADMEAEAQNRPYFDDIPIGKSSKNANNRGHQPWSSPSLRASPTDQLIAAILDGDVQGIRAIVRSKGEDLQSEFWHDLTRSVLPLHRAISGLHFHGSEKLLVATMEVLVQLGADINAVDHAGNNVLHKAIPVCTSKSINAVVRCLLNRGANPSMVNKEGDTPLHAECKR
jgi:ankyrin repeat protein